MSGLKHTDDMMSKKEYAQGALKKGDKADEHEECYCIFPYYKEAATFRTAIMKRLNKNRGIEKTLSDIREGKFNNYIYTQKAVGTTAFLSHIMENVKVIDKTYIDFNINSRHDSENKYYKQLIWFIKYVEINQENLSKFLFSLEKESKIQQRISNLAKGYYNGHKWHPGNDTEKIYEKCGELSREFEGLINSLFKTIYSAGKKISIEDFICLKSKAITDAFDKKVSELEDCIKRIDGSIVDDGVDRVIDEQSICSVTHLFCIDNIDIAFCDMFTKDKLKLSTVKKARTDFISAIQDINNCVDEIECIMALRKRPSPEEYRSKKDTYFSLRGKWVAISESYKDAFLPEIFFENCRIEKEEVYNSKYYCLEVRTCLGCKNFSCEYAIKKSKLQELYSTVSSNRGVKQNGGHDSISDRMDEFTQLCLGNPRYILESILAINKNYDKEDKYAFDDIIKDHFKKLWYYDKRPKFEEFLGTLPLYLLDTGINKDDYNEIYEFAVSFYNNLINESLKNNGVVKPFKVIKEFRQDNRPKCIKSEDMLTNIAYAFVDNYGVYESKQQRIENSHKIQQYGDMGKCEDIEYTVHDFVRYVHSNDTYFNSMNSQKNGVKK